MPHWSECFQCILQCLLQHRAHCNSRTVMASPEQLNQEHAFLCQKYSQSGEKAGIFKERFNYLTRPANPSSSVTAGIHSSSTPRRHLHQAPKFTRTNLIMHLQYKETLLEVENQHIVAGNLVLPLLCLGYQPFFLKCSCFSFSTTI